MSTPTQGSVSTGGLTVVEAPRPETRAEEDAYFLAAFRGALERIADALGMPGSPDLISGVPAEVERRLGRPVLTAQEALRRVLAERAKRAPAHLRREAAALRSSDLPEDRAEAAATEAAAESMERGSR